jgi:hypothetical protein
MGQPSVVSESDDVALTDLMARMEAENAEVAGDDDAESDMDEEAAATDGVGE